MSNTYRPVSEWAKAMYGEEDFDADYTAEDERDLLDGDLEIVPREYRVLSDNYTAGEQGSTLELALPVEIEDAQVAGGHIERVKEVEEQPEEDVEDEEPEEVAEPTEEEDQEEV